MSFLKEDKDKYFVCKMCNLFLDINELVNGKCPDCKSDDNLFHNELKEE